MTLAAQMQADARAVCDVGAFGTSVTFVRASDTASIVLVVVIAQEETQGRAQGAGKERVHDVFIPAGDDAATTAGLTLPPARGDKMTLVKDVGGSSALFRFAKILSSDSGGWLCEFTQ